MLKVLNSINNNLLLMLLSFGILFGPFGIYTNGISLNQLLLFILLAVSSSIVIFDFKISKTALLVSFAWLFLLIWFALLLPNLKNSNTLYAFSEAKSFMWSLLLFPIAISFKNGSLEKIFSRLSYVVILVSFVVCLVFVAASLGFPELGFGLRVVLGYFSRVAGSETDNIFIGPMPDGTFRVMWIFSIVLPFYFFWIIDNYNGIYRFLCIPVILLALVASGSRALIYVTFLIFILKYINKLKFKHLFIVTSLLTIFLVIFLPKLNDIRIFSIAEDISGATIRGNQIIVLTKEFLKAPLMGNGLGFYSIDAISNEAAPYSYEFVYLSLFTKIGIFGMLALLALVFMILNKVSLTRNRLLLVFAFLLITSTNPFLWSLLGMFCLCMSIYYPRKNFSPLQISKNL